MDNPFIRIGDTVQNTVTGNMGIVTHRRPNRYFVEYSHNNMRQRLPPHPIEPRRGWHKWSWGCCLHVVTDLTEADNAGHPAELPRYSPLFRTSKW